MNVALRQGMVSGGGGGGWSNPYVTDGLIGMWDGEWNAGPGVHNANTLIWKNLGTLGGDYDASRTIGTFGSDCAIFVRGNGLGTAFVIPKYLMRDKMKGEWTYEIVFLATTWSENYAGLFGNHGSQKGIVGGQYADGLVYFCLYDPNIYIWSTDRSRFSLNRKYSVSQCASNTLREATTYLDAAVVSEVSNVNVLLTYNQAPTYIGAAFGTAGRQFSGNIYCLRVYDRALSAAEVAANHAVDRTRFGLPDAT